MMNTHTRNLEGIEALRGVAALMVLLYHLVELLKVPLPGSLGFIRSHFGLGVPLFYALSGFVLAYGYSGNLRTPPDIRAFYIRRFFRIAPLFYSMLCAWLIVNWIVWQSKPSLVPLLLNVTFLFGLVPGMHESIVWAGWSIGIEMLFYLMFPVIALLTPTTVSAFGFTAGLRSQWCDAQLFCGREYGQLCIYEYSDAPSQLHVWRTGVSPMGTPGFPPVLVGDAPLRGRPRSGRGAS